MPVIVLYRDPPPDSRLILVTGDDQRPIEFADEVAADAFVQKYHNLRVGSTQKVELKI